ncbi:hypothetical protein Y032_0029g1945 [Ancylostoma ceylanicum]|uniref:Uncharacterized protein n=1 Tax=Ancylostoma ceylanicum TaxID=53326 RepID=A0A016USI7_9BILA|nr:hypothetical protein Y032_0029g1945 [Ancylostoma ceylanicum]
MRFTPTFGWQIGNITAAQLRQPRIQARGGCDTCTALVLIDHHYMAFQKRAGVGVFLRGKYNGEFDKLCARSILIEHARFVEFTFVLSMGKYTNIDFSESLVYSQGLREKNNSQEMLLTVNVYGTQLSVDGPCLPRRVL